MEKIKIGIMSAANIVPRVVAGMRESGVAEPTALAARSLEKATALAQSLDIPKVYETYEELVADRGLDLIYIPVYNQGHFAAAKMALEAGHHVLLEKPFTQTLAEAQALFQLAAEKKLFLMEAQKAVFLPLTQQIKQLLEEKVLGEVKYIRSKTAYPGAAQRITWFLDRQAGGGSLHSSGVYALHYLQYLLNEPIAELAGTSLLAPGQTDTSFQLSLRLGNTLASIFNTTDLATENELVIFGTEGTLTVPSFWKSQTAQLETSAGVQTISAPFASDFADEFRHVADCLKKGVLTSPIMTPAITLRTVGLIEKTYRQWYQKTSFRLVPAEKRLPELEQQVKAIWPEVFTPILGEKQVTYMLAHYQSLANIKEDIARGIRYYLLELDHEVVGYTAIEWQSDALYISKLYLQNIARGLGLAREVFDFYEKLALSEGRDRLRLRVNRENHQAVAVYEHRGFTVTVTEDTPLTEGFWLRDFVMEKRLS